jgi:hypothetical protein
LVADEAAVLPSLAADKAAVVASVVAAVVASVVAAEDSAGDSTVASLVAERVKSAMAPQPSSLPSSYQLQAVVLALEVVEDLQSMVADGGVTLVPQSSSNCIGDIAPNPP